MDEQRTIEITQEKYTAMISKVIRYEMLREYNKNNKYLSEWEKMIYEIHNESETE